MNKRVIILGIINAFHPILHLIQSIQSGLMLFDNKHEHDDIFEWFHNPFMNVLWGVIGIYTLFLFFKSFKKK